ncbi:MAG: Bax inhibitor-1/YccA family protein [Planctomycetota bacterium]|nr:Bax inhibitor-1/YccA family protein [Planctomycetota bacterium]
MYKSSNPVFTNDDKFNEIYNQADGTTKTNVTTVQGVVNKTAILTLVAVIAGAGGFSYFTAHPELLWMGCIAAFIVTIGIYFMIFGDPKKAVFLAPVYAVVQGVFLGGFTALAESMLASRGIAVAGGVALQAFVVTISVMLAMLSLYTSRIIKPNGKFMAIMATAAGAVAFMYLIGFMLSFVGIRMPYISISSTLATGTAGYIGLGVNLLFLGLASFMLIFDFKMVEDRVRDNSPKYMEWFCAFGLIVTLAWIYFESVKLVMRLASLFNRN